jgi:hypothetical protein
MQQVLAAERSLRRVEKGDQRRVFTLRQRDFGAVRVREAPGAAIELEAAEAIAAPLRLPM